MQRLRKLHHRLQHPHQGYSGYSGCQRYPRRSRLPQKRPRNREVQRNAGIVMVVGCQTRRRAGYTRLNQTPCCVHEVESELVQIANSIVRVCCVLSWYVASPLFAASLAAEAIVALISAPFQLRAPPPHHKVFANAREQLVRSVPMLACMKESVPKRRAPPSLPPSLPTLSSALISKKRKKIKGKTKKG